MREAERGAERSSSESWEKVGRRGRGGRRGAPGRPEVHRAVCSHPDLACPDRGPGTPGADPNPADQAAEKTPSSADSPPEVRTIFLRTSESSGLAHHPLVGAGDRVGGSF